MLIRPIRDQSNQINQQQNALLVTILLNKLVHFPEVTKEAYKFREL